MRSERWEPAPVPSKPGTCRYDRAGFSRSRSWRKSETSEGARLRKRLAHLVREPAQAARAGRQFLGSTSTRIAVAPGSVLQWRAERAERSAGETAWRAGDHNRAHAHFAAAARIGSH